MKIIPFSSQWCLKGQIRETAGGKPVLGFPPVLARSGSDVDPICTAFFINAVTLV